MKRTLLAIACIWGCGTSPMTSDAPSADAIRTVSCTGVTPVMTITTMGLAYSPMELTVPVGGIVEFMMPSQHNVASDSAGLDVPFGGTACLEFPVAGTFTYHCTAHGFMANITVQ
jgi:plastocyanin